MTTPIDTPIMIPIDTLPNTALKREKTRVIFRV